MAEVYKRLYVDGYIKSAFTEPIIRKLDAGRVVRAMRFGAESYITLSRGRDKREMATHTPRCLSVSRGSYADSRILDIRDPDKIAHAGSDASIGGLSKV